MGSPKGSLAASQHYRSCVWSRVLRTARALADARSVPAIRRREPSRCGASRAGERGGRRNGRRRNGARPTRPSPEPWSGGELATSLSRRGTEEGTRLFANLGLHQAWRLSERWFLDAGIDHSRTLGTRDSIKVNPATPYASSGVADFVSASLGVARHLPGESAGAFVERVDQALYASKHGGRNRVSLAA